MKNPLQKPKIIICITKSNLGGAQKYVFDLASNLQGDFEIKVLLGGNGILKTKLENNKIQTLAIKNLKNSLNPFVLPFEILKFIKIIRQEKPQIIHLNSSKMGLIGALGSIFFPKLKVVFTVHGFILNEPNRLKTLKYIFKIIYKIIFLLSDSIVAVSLAVKKDILKISKNTSQKITLIYNGISDITFFDRKDAKNQLIALSKNKLQPEDFIIGTIAELHPVKGLETLIKAFELFSKKIPHTKLLIIGEGFLRKKLEKLVMDLKIKDKVIFTGFLPEASKLLKVFDIFVISSVSEALAYTATESSLASLPIIATNVGGIPEIIKNGETGILIPPQNHKILFETILNIFNNKEFSTQLGSKAREYVIKKFALDQMLIQTRDNYLKVLITN